LSGGRFWARGRDQEPRGRDEGQGSETAEGGLAGALTAVDRCDRCGAQAYVRALLPNGLELLFCAHHTRQYSSALTEIAVGIHDETGRLTRPAA
jgi:hypothetical protein